MMPGGGRTSLRESIPNVTANPNNDAVRVNLALLFMCHGGGRHERGGKLTRCQTPSRPGFPLQRGRRMNAAESPSRFTLRSLGGLFNGAAA